MGDIRYKVKYKVGDKIKIKTWKNMEKEYGLAVLGSINNNIPMIEGMEKYLNEKYPDRILTIKEVKWDYYRMEENGYHWADTMIEYKIETEVFEPILTRWEILDIR